MAIHEALLRLCRVRRDRDGIIRELYKLGMGLYYLNRSVLGVVAREADSMNFENEMVFTEAASYLRYFETLSNEETRAYVLRAFANISICTTSFKRRIDVGMDFIRTVRSPEYRAMAPGLPWDTYLRRAHQQLSSSRTKLSSKEITQAEIAAVMDSCYEIFKPEAQSSHPSLRWLWPYYEMEYHCGYVSLTVTVERLEKLIREAPEGEYDASGIYGTIQLPIILGRMIRENPKLQNDPGRKAFLGFAYSRMMKSLMSVPPEMWDQNFIYTLTLVVSDFYEAEGLITYREVTARLMQRYAGRLYLRSLKAGALLACLCDCIWQREPAYFASLPVLQGIADPAARERTLLQYARDCGLYHDFGLFKLNMMRTRQTRNLFEREDAIYRLHTLSGYEDLEDHASTRIFADIARGHHSAYTGAPDVSGYVRMESPWRMMTDLVALVSDLQERGEGDIRAWARSLRKDPRFSPKAAAYLMEEEVQAALARVLETAGPESCRLAYEHADQ